MNAPLGDRNALQLLQFRKIDGEIEDSDGGYLSNLGPALQSRFRQADLLLRPLGNTVYVMPPYCISDEDSAWCTAV